MSRPIEVERRGDRSGTAGSKCRPRHWRRSLLEVTGENDPNAPEFDPETAALF